MSETECEFQTVAKVGDVPEGQGRAFVVAGTLVGVFLVDGEYFAINDICPHMGASLSAGSVEGHHVYCPWHAWRFSIQDGAWLDNPQSPLRAASYAVRVEGEDIQVAVPPEDAAN